MHCIKNVLTLLSFNPDEKCRPIKEIVEFPPRDIFVPHYSYRNLLFVSPKDLNFSNRPGREDMVFTHFLVHINFTDILWLITSKSQQRNLRDKIEKHFIFFIFLSFVRLASG